MKKLDAYSTFLILTGADGLIMSLIFTVNMIYQATVVGLEPLQLVLVGTTLELAIIFCEVPTGVVADVYSRRLSVIIGYALIGVGFIVEGAFPFFAPVLIAQILWGVGYTFTSGALEAWLTDEIGEARAGHAFLRASQVAQVATFAGIAASVGIGNLQVNLPILFGGVSLIGVALWLALVMPETAFTPKTQGERDSFAAMWRTLRAGIAMAQKRPALKTILGIGWFHGLFSEGVDRLWTPFLLTFAFPVFDGLTTITWFGIIRGVAALLGIIGNEVARRRVRLDDEASIRRALFGMNVGIVLALFAFAGAPNFALAVIAFWIVSLLRRTHEPLHTTWVNQRLDSNVRATVISLSGQVDALGQIIGGPVVGAIGNGSLRAALFTSATILTPALALFTRAAKQDT